MLVDNIDGITKVVAYIALVSSLFIVLSLINKKLSPRINDDSKP